MATDLPPNPVGRPTEYTKEIGDAICDWIAGGKSLNSYCKQENTPDKVTVLRWLRRPEPNFVEFRTHYTLAREDQAHSRFDSNADISEEDVPITEKGGMDMGAVQDKKLRIDTNFKMAAIMLPKKYAPVTKSEHSGPNGGAIPVKGLVKEMSDEELSAFIANELAAKQRSEERDTPGDGPGTGAPAPSA